MLRDKKRLQNIIRELLADKYLSLHIDDFVYGENLVKREARISFGLRDKVKNTSTVLVGNGSGIVEALFDALTRHLAEIYHTIGHFEISSFTVRGDADTGKTIHKTDASATVIMRVLNARNQEFEFRHTSESVTRSSACVVLAAVEYFVNAERAYVVAYEALKAARRANNPDLQEKYTRILSELVVNTSYSDLVKDIERKRKRLR